MGSSATAWSTRSISSPGIKEHQRILVPEEKQPSVTPGFGLVHALHDWKKYKDPVEYRNMSHSHCHFPLEMGVSALTQSSVDRGKVGAL